MSNKATFIIGSTTVHLIAGHKAGGAAVACVVELELSELQSLTVYYPMGSIAAAQRFVSTATAETAERGYKKVMEEHGAVLELVNKCFSSHLPDWKRLGKN